MKTLCITILIAVSASVVHGQGAYGVLEELKVSSTTGGFGGVLGSMDGFGQGHAELGDLDGDGFVEFAVGAPGDDDGGSEHGAVWIVSLNPDGSVRSESKISDTAGGFTGVLDTMDFFGNELECLGDINADGRVELVVAATLDDDGATDTGAIWILSLNSDGTVFSHTKISATTGGFTGPIAIFDTFGQGLLRLPDFDGDGIPELAVGVPLSDRGGFDRGAIFILFLNPDGTVRSHQEISTATGGFGGALSNEDFFGRSMAWIGDLDGDGFGEMAVGAQLDDDGGADRGAVWILSLNPDGTVRSETKISDTVGGFNGVLDDGCAFGVSMDWLGDNDGDGFGELAVSANLLDRGGVADVGGFWILSLDATGTVVAEQEISTDTSFSGPLDVNDRLGSELSLLPDLQGTGTFELAIGATNDDDGGMDRGSFYVLSIGRAASAVSRNSGSNPSSLNGPAPVLGQVYVATVDLTTTGHDMAMLVGFKGQVNQVLSGGQTILTDIASSSGELLGLLNVVGPVATFSMLLPLDLNLAGFDLSLQAIHLGTVVPFALSNAIDVVLGS